MIINSNNILTRIIEGTVTISTALDDFVTSPIMSNDIPSHIVFIIIITTNSVFFTPGSTIGMKLFESNSLRVFGYHKTEMHYRI
jgi:hypothetical protein